MATTKQQTLLEAAEKMAKPPIGEPPISPDEAKDISLSEAEQKRKLDDLSTQLAKQLEANKDPKTDEQLKEEVERQLAVRARDEMAKATNASKAAAAPPRDGGKPATAGAKEPAAAQPAILTRKGRMRRPRRMVIYGPPGVGKTTLAADATSEPGVEDVIVVDIDNGSESLDVPRYLFRPDDVNRGHVPNTLEELIGGIRQLRKTVHPYKRVVFDQLDRLELLVQRYCLRRDQDKDTGGLQGAGLETYGFGKGKQILLDEMRHVLNEFDGLIAKGIDVLILAHSTTVKWSNPNGADYDRYQLKCSPLVAGYVYEWADEVGFLHFDDTTFKIGGKRGKDKGKTTGRRLLEFDHSAAWDAKARLPLPRNVPVGSANPWSFYREAIRRAYQMTASDLREEIAAELRRIGDDELVEKVGTAVAAVKDNIDKLTAYMQDLRRRPAIEKPDDAGGASSDDDTI